VQFYVFPYILYNVLAILFILLIPWRSLTKQYREHERPEDFNCIPEEGVTIISPATDGIMGFTQECNYCDCTPLPGQQPGMTSLLYGDMEV